MKISIMDSQERKFSRRMFDKYLKFLLIIFFVFFLSIPEIQARGNAGVKVAVQTAKVMKKARGTLSKWVQKKPGLYKFKSSNGQMYFGRSLDLRRRLKQHLKSGKLLPKNFKTIKIFYHPKKGLNKVEKNAIRYYDLKSKGNIANIQNAIMSQSKKKLQKGTKSLINDLKKHIDKKP